MFRRWATLFAVTVALGCGVVSDAESAPGVTAQATPPKVYTKTVLSKPYHIDAKYKSMRGPYGFDDVALLDTDTPELLWITGYSSTVVDAKSDGAMSQEWMCHANLDFEPTDYYGLFDTRVPLSGRLFTLSQGQQDIEFPEGFGIPVTSNLPITLATQVLNLNDPNPDLTVKHKVEIHFVRDAELTTPMKPLFQGAVEGFKALGDARYYGIDESDVNPDIHGAGCSVGQAAIAGDVDPDRKGQEFTAHWVVKPGLEVNRTNVTRFLNLPFDTTAHYIAVHLHPYARSLELVDLTAGETVFRSEVDPADNRIGIEHVDHYSSQDGLKLYKDHEYELVSVYDNTSTEDADSMAVMYLYMFDPTFEKPDLDKAAKFAPEKDKEKKGGSM